MKKFAYQGIAGSFTHAAARQAASTENSVDFIGAASFREIFYLVSEGKADYGVVPIENSIAGSVFECYDHLSRFPVFVTKELYLSIHHQLLTLPDAADDPIKLKKVYSHPKAFEQCGKFFDNFPHLERVVVSDTARAALQVHELGDPTVAAIASAEAGDLYGLKTLQANIEDVSENFTRFLMLQHEATPREEVSQLQLRKYSVIFSLPHRPGSLLEILSLLAASGANLTKIESRPIAEKPFEYIFYLDFELKGWSAALSEKLKIHTSFFRLVGSVDPAKRIAKKAIS